MMLCYLGNLDSHQLVNNVVVEFDKPYYIMKKREAIFHEFLWKRKKNSYLFDDINNVAIFFKTITNAG